MWPAAALGIIIGTKCGETARSPPSKKLRHSRSSVSSPPTPVPTTTPRRSGSMPSGSPASVDGLVGGGDGELAVAIGAAHVLGGHGRLRVELRARADAVGDARPLGEQRLEERVGALADRGDDPPAGDDDLGRGAHADTPSFSRTSSCTVVTASPTEAIDFRRPSAIWIS